MRQYLITPLEKQKFDGNTLDFDFKLDYIFIIYNQILFIYFIYD